MKALPESLASHLAGGVTTLARCWIVTRNDGLALGFTDHDRPLYLEGVLCSPENGLETSATSAGPGFAIGGSDVSGTLNSAGLADTDLAAGLWDGTDVKIYLVNWQDPSEPLLQRRARIGEVSRSGAAFTAELRGLAHVLETRQGRVFSSLCDADLGDSRCKVAVNSPAYRATTTVTASTREWVEFDGLSTFSDNWFAAGRLVVETGTLQGFASEIASHRTVGTVVRLTLWQSAPEPIGAGNTVEVTAGCDKHFATCREKFANHLNFQGFPHMPGSDFVLSYPNSNAGRNDGGPRVT